MNHENKILQIKVVNIILYHTKHHTKFLIYKNNNMYSKLIQQYLPLSELNLAYHRIIKYDM